MKSTPRQLKEATKAYEKVVDHLIAEGYANNKVAADNIISGINEKESNKSESFTNIKD